MISRLLDRWLGKYWFRRGLAIAVLCYTFRLTTWSGTFAYTALLNGSDLTGVAAIIAAVAAIPLGLLTLVFQKYNESRTTEDADSPS
jgi:hypothetical protein